MSGLETALAQAALGREVFPFALRKGPGGKFTKTPLVKWQDAGVATADADAIKAMWAKWPTAQPGWRLPAGSIVVDIDNRAAFDKAALALPETARQATPSGGSHHLYSLRDGRDEVRQFTNKGLGCDTRVGGRGWVGLYAPDSFAGARAMAPQWLYDAPQAAQPAAGVAERQMGTRSDILAFLGVMRRVGASEGAMLAALKAERECGRLVALDDARPWEDGDLATLAREAARWRPSDEPLGGELTVNFVRPGAGERAALQVPPLVTVDARDLIAHPPPKPIEIVEDLLLAGLTLLASAPKVGKSWLAYQFAVAVATGGEVLGKRASQGDVLYLALEDGEYRAHTRGRQHPATRDRRAPLPTRRGRAETRLQL